VVKLCPQMEDIRHTQDNSLTLGQSEDEDLDDN